MHLGASPTPPAIFIQFGAHLVLEILRLERQVKTTSAELGLERRFLVHVYSYIKTLCYVSRYIRLLTNVLEWQKKHQQQVTINNNISTNNTNNSCNKNLEVQVKCEAPLCNCTMTNGTCSDGAMTHFQQSYRCRHHRHTHHLLMLKAPLVCDRNGNSLLMIEPVPPFLSSANNNKIHRTNQGNATVFNRPPIKVEKEEDTAKTEEDLKAGEDFEAQKPGTDTDEKEGVPKTSAVVRTSVCNQHVPGGRGTPVKLTRTPVPTAFVHQQLKNRRARTPTGNVREVQCWASNFQPEKDNKNLHKK